MRHNSRLESPAGTTHVDRIHNTGPSTEAVYGRVRAAASSSSWLPPGRDYCFHARAMHIRNGPIAWDRSEMPQVSEATPQGRDLDGAAPPEREREKRSSCSGILVCLSYSLCVGEPLHEYMNAPTLRTSLLTPLLCSESSPKAL